MNTSSENVNSDERVNKKRGIFYCQGEGKGIISSIKYTNWRVVAPQFYSSDYTINNRFIDKRIISKNN